MVPVFSHPVSSPYSFSLTSYRGIYKNGNRLKSLDKIFPLKLTFFLNTWNKKFILNNRQIRKGRNMDKIVKYEVKLSVPQSQVSQHQKRFENILHTAINKGLKGTDLVSVVKVTKWGSQSTTTKEDNNELVHNWERMEKEEILDLPTTTYTRKTGESIRKESVEFVWNCEPITGAWTWNT